MALYGGRPVPRGPNTSPTAEVMEEWFENHSVVPADDGESVLVFSKNYLNEDDDGNVVFDDEERGILEDEKHLHFYDVFKILQRLHDRGSSDQRNLYNASFLGATAAAYRIEKPDPGLFPATTLALMRAMLFSPCVSAGQCNISQLAASPTTQA